MERFRHPGGKTARSGGKALPPASLRVSKIEGAVPIAHTTTLARFLLRDERGSPLV